MTTEIGMKDKDNPPARMKSGAPPKPPPGPPVDLVKLSDDELALLTVEAPRELERRKAKREADLLGFIRERAAELGISPARLGAALAGRAGARAHNNGGTDGRSVVKPKYRNPKDHAQRWSGRGGQPAWVADHLAAGGTLEECLIPEGAL
jgi:DNA-binding protein H-NS